MMPHMTKKKFFTRLECAKIALTRTKRRTVLNILAIINAVVPTWRRALHFSLLYGITLEVECLMSHGCKYIGYVPTKGTCAMTTASVIDLIG